MSKSKDIEKRKKVQIRFSFMFIPFVAIYLYFPLPPFILRPYFHCTSYREARLAVGLSTQWVSNLVDSVIDPGRTSLLASRPPGLHRQGSRGNFDLDSITVFQVYISE